jgi:hypothetical protein
VQVPEQVVVERDAAADQSFAVIDQQPDVELDAGQLRRRQAVEALAQRGPGDGQGVDAVGLAAIAAGATRVAHELGRYPDDAFPAGQEKPLEGARHVPAVLKRPGAIVAEAARPVQQRDEAGLADLDRLVTQRLAGGRGDRRDGV